MAGLPNNQLNTPPWRAGDWVEIRAIDEIMATLDATCCLEALPFMPEMAAYCGRRFRIAKVAHKTCDPTGNSDLRRLDNVVHLETRCDGSNHGGCQAGCTFFWKTAWLKKFTPDKITKPAKSTPAEYMAKLERAARPTEETYRCQATEIIKASTPISSFNPLYYWRDLTSRNVSPKDFIRYGILSILKSIKAELVNPPLNALKEYLNKRRGKTNQTAQTPAQKASLNLRVGESVRIRPRPEIMETLSQDRKNYGLSFDSDMMLYCGTSHRVHSKVERVIDEKTGKMLKISRDCLILEDVTCTGLACRNRMFCPRSVYTFWREAWLERDNIKN